MREYIIQVNDNKYGWCLERLAGTNEIRAKEILAKTQAENPNKEFRLCEVNNEECWWNNNFLAN